MSSDVSCVFHLVARVDLAPASLCEFEVGSWFWSRLREAFPEALGACLMPDHPHVVTRLDSPPAGRMRLNRLLGQLARRLGVRQVGRAAQPTVVADTGKLLCDLRYVALNPPRAGKAKDPLCWLFSTHRDVIGAVADPWITADRLARAVRRPRRGFAEWFHSYVSADPSVVVDGTPYPHPALPSDLPTWPLAMISRAVAAATRSRPEEIRRQGLSRNLFVGLAREQGWRHTGQLARACATTARAIQRIAGRVEPDALAPVRLCLGDRRLLEGVPR